MKRILYLGVLAGVILVSSCQNELYKDASSEYQSSQGAYIKDGESAQVFVEEGKDVEVKSVTVALVQQENESRTVEVEAGNQAQLDAYNKKHGTAYLMLPSDMYEVEKEVVFDSKQTAQFLPVKLKDVKFSLQGSYALPLRLSGGTVPVIAGESESLIVLEQRINTKCLRMNGYGSEDANMFPADFKVDQWTMEVMVNRSAYVSNNRSICGTKLVTGSSMLDEIYPRFGDVTIRPDQLQIKTGNSQIDVPADVFTAHPDTWYMLSFVYDGKKNYVYVNGELVADREIRTGPYGLVGFWIGGANELVREVRFWKTARTPQQLKQFMWKMVDGSDENLVLYYPLNGKKRDKDTGEITEDETKLWDWSNNAKHLPMPSGAMFDDNNGNGFIFPLVD